MGQTLSVQTITDVQIPSGFSKTDSKALVGQLLGYYEYVRSGFYQADWGDCDLVKLLRHLGVDLKPLANIGGGEEEEPLDSFYARDPSDERVQLWHKLHAENIERESRAWQEPSLLIDAISRFLKALDSQPGVYSLAGINNEYFTSGYFQIDIKDLLKMAVWARDQEIKFIKIVIR
jgi:hypothetical protein